MVVAGGIHRDCYKSEEGSGAYRDSFLISN